MIFTKCRPFQVLRCSLTLLFVAAAAICNAQTALTPGSNLFEKKWLKTGTYEMACYSVSNGTKSEFSSFVYEVVAGNKQLAIYTSLNLLGSDERWVDTCIADEHTFRPVYRSSFNRNREYAIQFGKEVTGHYYDKKTKKKNVVNDAVETAFFDSYLYPYILGMLPLASGYSATLPVYDYKPENTGNVKHAIIEEVKNSIYVSDLTGEHKTWKISVLEQATNDKYEYYIDKETRRLWKVEIFSKGQELLMVDKEVDYNPIKATFDKAATLKQIKSGSAVISGQAFAKDNENEGLLSGIAVVNINKKQYARNGTTVVLIPYTAYFREWLKFNESSRKKGKGFPLPKEVAECMKVTTVYDDNGHFEFVNLMPGDYLVYTEFGYVHTSRRTEVVGYTDTYVNGLFQGTSANTVTNNYGSNASAAIKKVVTIKKPGENVEIKLKKTL